MKIFKRIHTVGKSISLSISIVVMMFATLAIAGPTGQVEFDDLSSHYGEPKVEINLSSGLMNMVASFAKHEDPEIGEILAGLEFIKIRVYNLNGEVEQANLMIDSVSQKLRADSWEALVTVNDYEENEQVRIFSKTTNDVIDGVVVMVVSPEKDGGEGVFINIVGEIDPNKIAKLTDTLNIDIN